MEVRPVTDWAAWDEFVETSKQGTIFCTSKWLNLFDIGFEGYVVLRGNEIVGGIVGFDDEGFTSFGILTPFQGILYAPTNGIKKSTISSLHMEVQKALIDSVGTHVKILNHYTVTDIRPFLWAGYEPLIKYTYIIDLTDMELLWSKLEKQTRYEITRAERDGVLVNVAWHPKNFARLYELTFERKGMQPPVDRDFILKLCKEFNPDIRYMERIAEDKAATLVVKDSKRAYYILGASSGGGVSSLVLWDTFGALSYQGVKEIDLVGCNDEKISNFKKGFGGRLVPYYGVKL